MQRHEQHIEDEQALVQVLGYLNFSSGNPDPKFLGNLNRIWRSALASESTALEWQGVGQRLRAGPENMNSRPRVSQDSTQTVSVLSWVLCHVVKRCLKVKQ